jgi:hypothetical protein
MAHNGTGETCTRHLPWWKKQGDVVFFSPSDSVMRLGGYSTWSYGRRGHHTKDALDRFLMMLKMSAQTSHQHFVIHEYDSVAFEQLASVPDTHLAGIRFTDGRPNSKFVGHQFIHPPLQFSRSVLLRLIETFESLTETEQFMWDRWLGLACERSKIPIFDMLAFGFSSNTITAAELPSAAGAIACGARWFHGIKSAKIFDAIVAEGKWKI